MKLQLRFYSNVKKTVEASVAKNRIVESLAKNDAMEPGFLGESDRYLPETNLKMDGWKTSFLLEGPTCRGSM